MTTFFTADQHWHHDRIRALCQRPHASVEAMDADMIAQWNAVVGPGDTVYHLGDFSFDHPETVFPHLHGHKHLIIGNHDSRDTLRLPWASREIYRELKLVEDGVSISLVLFHYPIEECNNAYRGAVHLHGHTHGRLADKPGRCDVGVDRWAMTPVSLAQIRARLLALAA